MSKFLKKLCLGFLFFALVSLGHAQNHNPSDPDGDAEQASPSSSDLDITSDQSSGAGYRKIALNGAALPDQKPQQDDETDDRREETYIDALTLGLRHDTTDVYYEVPASDLRISVRRNLSSHVWTRGSGLRPNETPDMPFGVCWGTNLAPSIHITQQTSGVDIITNPNTAVVTDSDGESHTFAIIHDWDYGSGVTTHYVPVPTSRTDHRAFLATLTASAEGGFVFKKKYGTVINFSYVQGLDEAIPADRLSGGGMMIRHKYYRATEAVDRYGNRLTYAYPNSNTLTPSEISSGGNLLLGISVNASGLIESVTDANGNVTEYEYDDFDYTSYPFPYSPNIPLSSQIPLSVKFWRLTRVLYPDGGSVQYEYDNVSEQNDKYSDRPKEHLHQDVVSITDGRGNTHTISRLFDRTKKNTDGVDLYYFPAGLPRVVNKITLPNGAESKFDFVGTVGYFTLQPGLNQRPATLTWNGARSVRVLDARGDIKFYHYGDPYVEILNKFQYASGRVKFDAPRLVFYKKLDIIYYPGAMYDIGFFSKETFQFSPAAGMALSKVTDISGNETNFEYEDDYYIKRPLNEYVFQEAYGYYSDPTAEVNALGGRKEFGYGENRIMNRSVDANGVVTRQRLDSEARPSGIPPDHHLATALSNAFGRRLSETVIESAGTVLSHVSYDFPDTYTRPGISYPAGLSKNFVTRKIVHKISSAAGDPAWVQDMVTIYVPSATGRVWKEIVDPDGLALTTEYTYDANGNRLSVKDPRGNVTAFEYDERNRLVKTTFPDSHVKQFEYDYAGNRVRETDENLVVTIREFDSLNRLTRQALDMNDNQLIDPGIDIIEAYSYDNLNAKVASIDPRGVVTRFEYSHLGPVISKVEDYTEDNSGLNYRTRYEYSTNSGGSVFDSTNWKPTAIIDPLGYRTEITYDALYRPIEEKVQYKFTSGGDRIYATTTKTYDAVGNLLSVTDPLGAVTKTVFDGLGRPVTITDGFGTSISATTTKSYTSTGLAWRSVDALARETTTEYDAAGRPIKAFAPAVDDALTTSVTLVRPITETVYDAAGNVAAVINPLGRRTDYTYDTRNRRTKEELPSVMDASTGLASRPTITTAYDAVGNVVSVKDARNNVTSTQYDAARRPLTITAPEVLKLDATSASPVTIMTYDLAGNVLTLINPDGNETVNTYDNLGRLATTSQSPTANPADDITITNEYDSVGNRIAVIDGKSQRTEFTYDGLKRNTAIKDPANRSVIFEFDALNKVARVDSLSQRTEYTYDARHRLTNVSYIGRSVDNRTYAYDIVGQLLSVTEAGKGGVADVAYTYDALGRQLTETSHGRTHSYTYDTANNRITVTYGGTGTLLTSTYDVLNRLETLTENGRVTTYGYDLSGNRVLQEQPNGESIETTYDGLNRRTAIHTFKSGGVALQSLVHVYDLSGNLVRLVESYPGATINGRTVTNTYDGVNRLVREVNEEGASKVIDTTYVFDKANNRTAKIVETNASGGVTTATTDYDYNNLNQLVSYTTAPPAGASVTVDLTYDHNGNRISRVSGGQTDTYGYDYENRLLALTKNTAGGVGSYSYVYDYRTRRVQRVESGATTNLVFSGGVSVSEYDGAAPSVVSAEYIRGSDWGGGVGGLLYSVRSGTASFKHYNSRGDVISETNSIGTTTWQATYEAFGTRTQEVGATQDRQKANTKEEDPTGLLNEGFRYRCLETGVFITRDPLGFVDGPNMYAYVIQNPWSKFDPEGLESRKGHDDYEVKGKGHHEVPVETWKENKFSKDVQGELDKVTIDAKGHNYSGHGQYNKRVDEITKDYIAKSKMDPSGLSGKDAKKFADGLVDAIRKTNDPYVKEFNKLVAAGKSAEEIRDWSRSYKAGVITGTIKDGWALGAGKYMGKGGVVGGASKVLGAVGRKLPTALKVVAATATVTEVSSDLQAGESVGEVARTQYYRFGSLEGNTPEEQKAIDQQRSDSFFNWLTK